MAIKSLATATTSLDSRNTEPLTPIIPENKETTVDFLKTEKIAAISEETSQIVHQPSTEPIFEFEVIDTKPSIFPETEELLRLEGVERAKQESPEIIKDNQTYVFDVSVPPRHLDAYLVKLKKHPAIKIQPYTYQAISHLGFHNFKITTTQQALRAVIKDPSIFVVKETNSSFIVRNSTGFSFRTTRNSRDTQSVTDTTEGVNQSAQNSLEPADSNSSNSINLKPLSELATSYLVIQLPHNISQKEIHAVLRNINFKEVVRNPMFNITQDSAGNLVIQCSAERSVIDLLALAGKLLLKHPTLALYLNTIDQKNKSYKRGNEPGLKVPRAIMEQIITDKRLNYLLKMECEIPPDSTEDVNVLSVSVKVPLRSARELAGQDYRKLVSTAIDNLKAKKTVNFHGQRGSGKSELILNIIQREKENTQPYIDSESNTTIPREVVPLHTQFRDIHRSSLGAGLFDIAQQLLAGIKEKFPSLKARYGNLPAESVQAIENTLALSDNALFAMAKTDPGELIKVTTTLINNLARLIPHGTYYFIIEDRHFADIVSSKLLTTLIDQVHKQDNVRIITSSRLPSEYERSELAAVSKPSNPYTTDLNVPLLNIARYNQTKEKVVIERVEVINFVKNYLRTAELVKSYDIEVDPVNFGILISYCHGIPLLAQNLIKFAFEHDGYMIINNNQYSIKPEFLSYIDDLFNGRITPDKVDDNSLSTIASTIDTIRLSNHDKYTPSHKKILTLISMAGIINITDLYNTIRELFPELRSDTIDQIIVDLIEGNFIEAEATNNTTQVKVKSFELINNLRRILPAEVTTTTAEALLFKSTLTLDPKIKYDLALFLLKAGKTNRKECLKIVAETLDTFRINYFAASQTKRIFDELSEIPDLLDGQIATMPIEQQSIIKVYLLVAMSQATLQRDSEELEKLLKGYQNLNFLPIFASIQEQVYSFAILGFYLARSANSDQNIINLNNLFEYCLKAKQAGHTGIYKIGQIYFLYRLGNKLVTPEMVAKDNSLQAYLGQKGIEASMAAGQNLRLPPETALPIRNEVKRLLVRIEFEKDRQEIEFAANSDTREIYPIQNLHPPYVERAQQRLLVLKDLMDQFTENPSSVIESNFYPSVEQFAQESMITFSQLPEEELPNAFTQLFLYCNQNLAGFALNQNNHSGFARAKRFASKLQYRWEAKDISYRRLIDLIDLLSEGTKKLRENPTEPHNELLRLDAIVYLGNYLRKKVGQNLPAPEYEEIMHLIEIAYTTFNYLLEHFNYNDGTDLDQDTLFDWGAMGHIIHYLEFLVTQKPHEANFDEEIPKATKEPFNASGKLAHLKQQLSILIPKQLLVDTIAIYSTQCKGSPTGIVQSNLEGLSILQNSLK